MNLTYAVWEGLVFLVFFSSKSQFGVLNKKLFLLQAKLRLINSYTNDCLVCLLTTARKRQQRVPFI